MNSHGTVEEEASSNTFDFCKRVWRWSVCCNSAVKVIGYTMSQQTPADPGRPGHPGNLGPLRRDYVPTEEEKRVFRECNQESFWYSSVPLSVITMTVTQLLISRGFLTASPRFGSFPKLAFAGFCGYAGGKMLYMKKCVEKFKNLENSPLGEALRQQQRHQQPKFSHEQPELSDPYKNDSGPAFQLDDQKDPSYTRDLSYSDRLTSTTHSDTQITADSSYVEEEDAQKRHVLYEDLRSKNRGSYEVTMTKKSEMLLKPSSESSSDMRGKKNKYGDTWEE